MDRHVWSGPPTTRMFKENGETVYLRFLPGDALPKRITAEKQEQIERAARDRNRDV